MNILSSEICVSASSAVRHFLPHAVSCRADLWVRGQFPHTHIYYTEQVFELKCYNLIKLCNIHHILHCHTLYYIRVIDISFTQLVQVILSDPSPSSETPFFETWLQTCMPEEGKTLNPDHPCFRPESGKVESLVALLNSSSEMKLV